MDSDFLLMIRSPKKTLIDRYWYNNIQGFLNHID